MSETDQILSNTSVTTSEIAGSPGIGVQFFPSTSDIIGVTFNEGPSQASEWQKRFVRTTAPSGYGGSLITPIARMSTTSNSTGGESFKTRASHEFGIVYFDERGRHGAVQSIGSAYVPGYSVQERGANEFGAAYVRLNINHAPPEWAVSYRIVYAGNNTISEFVQCSTPGAFVAASQETGQTRIYVSLNYLQTSEASYAEAYGAISQDDGTKVLYRHAPGDTLRIIGYSSTSGTVFRPNQNYEFRVLGTETLDPDMTSHPLFEGEDAGGDINRSGEFLVLEDNPVAIGFSITDIAAGTDKWKDRCIFEISRPRKEIADSAKPYYETNYGGQILPNGDHQYNEILMTKGDVYYRQVPVGANQVQGGNFVSTISGGVDNPNISSNFVGYFLETEGFTDLYKADSKSYGRIHFLDPNASEVERSSSLMFSEKTFTGSLDINYFSFPQIGNFKDLPLANGGVNRLISDNVLLHAYQDSKVSYLPVARDVLQTGQEDAIVTSSKVLGTATEIPITSSIYGHGESVIVIEGDHYYFDPRLQKVMMLKDGKNPVCISDYGVDSYVKSKVEDWAAGGSWKAILGHDPDNNELLFCLVNKGDLPLDPTINVASDGDSKSTSKLNSYQRMGVLAFDLMSKKRWKTRYSYLSHIFSKIGNSLVSFWGSAAQTTPWRHGSDYGSNQFFNKPPSDTSFVCVSNAGTETVKEFVMLNAVSDRWVDAKIKTDQQSEYADSFRVWKDYDGIKYSEIPKTNVNIDESRLTQRLKFLPAYPNTNIGMDPLVTIKNIGTMPHVFVTANIPLESSFWRPPCPVGKETFIVEQKFGEQEVYPIGAHPDSDYVFDRKAFINRVYVSDTGMGKVEAAMPLTVFLSQFNSENSVWEGTVSANVTDTSVTISAFEDIYEEITIGGNDAVQINFAVPGADYYPVDENGNATDTPLNLGDAKALELTRLLVMPLVSGIGIAATNAERINESLYIDGTDLTSWNPSDFNNDGAVNTADLLEFLTEFGNPESGPADLNNDGSVSTADLLEFLTAFGSIVQYGCKDPLANNYDPDADIDDGTCTYDNPDDGGGGVEEETDEEDPKIDIWNVVTGSVNARLYIGYVGDIDGDYTKGRYMSIEVTANPINIPALNFESLLVDHNTAVKKSRNISSQTRKRKK